MGFDIKVVTDCLKLSRKQIQELLFTVILPITAGIAFIASLWPSLIKDGRTLNICLLGFVAALPMVLINNVVWSLLFIAFLERVIRILAVSFFVSSPGLKKNELVRGKMRRSLEKIFDEVPFFDDIRFEAISSFDFRHIASVLTAIGFYLTAIIICLFDPGTLISALGFLVVALLPAICSVIIANRIFSELQSKLSKMTHHEIIAEVSQFVDRHCPSDVIERLRSFVYVFLDGDRNRSLSEILDSRMKIADSVLLEGEEIHEEQDDKKTEDEN